MKSLRALTGVSLTGLLLLSGGCGIFKTELDKCHEAREYQQARTGSRTQVPADLQPLSEDAWVPIPEGETRTQPTPADEPCLIEPPDYRNQD